MASVIGETPRLVLQLKYCRVEVYPFTRVVRTVFSEHNHCDAIRDESSPANLQEAAEEGYTGKRTVWQSLVEHETLHSLVAQVLFDQPSAVLSTESGLKTYPLWQRYEEEMICLGIQLYLNTGKLIVPLQNYNFMKVIGEWNANYKSRISKLVLA